MDAYADNHTCNPIDCPPTGNYFVSAVDGPRYWLMAGPYQLHSEALADVKKALNIAYAIDGRAWWKGWGTCRVKDGSARQGVLNKHNLL